MSSHEHTVVVDRPVGTVYDQWTQFESYPAFMDDVTLVRQVDAAMTHWRVKIGGVEREYDAAIIEQRPREVIAWRSIEGPKQEGWVNFVPLGPDRTRVTLRLDFEPHGIAENVGEKMGVVSTSVERSLDTFKEFIEHRDAPTGAWKGEIHDGVPTSSTGVFTDPARATPAVETDEFRTPRDLQE